MITTRVAYSKPTTLSLIWFSANDAQPLLVPGLGDCPIDCNSRATIRAKSMVSGSSQFSQRVSITRFVANNVGGAWAEHVGDR